MADYQIPDRNFARQVRTVFLWALIPIFCIAVPLIVVLVVVVDTSGDTDAIRTTQDQADRNLVAQACTSRYAATATAWEDEADRLEARIVKAAVDDLPTDPDLAQRSVDATDNAAEMTRRRLGLSTLVSDEATVRDADFACPMIPDRLQIEPLDPTDPRPPVNP